MWSELRDSSLGFTAEEIQTITTLSRLRDAQGTIFTREFAKDLGISPSTPDLDGAVLERLNGWFDRQLVHEDPTSKRIRGMVELVTDTRWRPFTDLLIWLATGRPPVLHPQTVEVQKVDGNEATVRLVYPPLEIPTARSPRQREWTTAIRHCYDAFAERLLSLPRLSSEAGSGQEAEFAACMTNPMPGIVRLDVSHTFVENLQLAALLKEFGNSGQRVQLAARHSIFAGAQTNLGGVEYDLLDAEGAIFLSAEVSFREAVFACRLDEEELVSMQAINLRDTHFGPKVHSVCFDDIEIAGDTRLLTFEDAVIENAELTFTQAKLGEVEVGFYQAQFGKDASVEFTETQLRDTQVSFVDASLEGRVVFYRTDPLGQLDLSFRQANELRIENCTLAAPLRIGNVRRISFSGSSLAGGSIAVQGAAVVAGAKADPLESRLWFLDAIANGRQDHTAELAGEYAVVKEIFHGMGEYDLEDEAFVRHMRCKHSGPLGRLLDILGSFGTKPLRILASFAVIWGFWVIVDWLALRQFPNAFAISGSSGSTFLDAAIAASFSLTQGTSAVTPLAFWANMLWLAQSLIGWFFLGYYFAAFIRRTLR